MANLTNLKLTLTSDRKLVSIESDDFRIKLNGNTNADYAAMLKPLGVVIEFKNEDSKIKLVDEATGREIVIDGPPTATTQ